MRFVFKLEPLLAQRRAIERETRAAFEIARRRLSEAQASLDRLAAAFAASAIDQFARCELEAAMKRQTALVTAESAEVDRTRSAFVAARRDRKALEMLKARRLQHYKEKRSSMQE